MDTSVLLLMAVLAGLLFLWLRFRRSRSEADDTGARHSRSDALDTVAGWPPEATRVLTHPERRAYTMLSEALPDYMVLAQVPLSRFVRVPTRNSYTEWMRRVGQLCADLVICDKGSQVIAVVEVRRPSAREGDRSRKRHERMDRVLRKAGIRVLEWNEEALPHPETVREQVLPTPKDLGAPSTHPGAVPRGAATPRAARPPTLPPIPIPIPMPAATALRGSAPAAGMAAAAASAAPRPAASAPATLDEVLEEIDRAGAAAEFTLPEPTPSTWFDEYESGPTPLHPQPKQR